MKRWWKKLDERVKLAYMIFIVAAFVYFAARFVIPALWKWLFK